MSVKHIESVGFREFGEGAPIAKGTVIPGHRHNYGHATLILSGAFKIEELMLQPAAEDELLQRLYPDRKPALCETLEAPWDELLKIATVRTVIEDARPFKQVPIKAGVYHRMTALEDGSRYICIFAHRDMAGEVCLSYSGNPRAYS